MKLELVVNVIQSNPHWSGGASIKVPDKLLEVFELSPMPSDCPSTDDDSSRETAVTTKLKVNAALELSRELAALIVVAMSDNQDDIRRELSSLNL